MAGGSDEDDDGRKPYRDDAGPLWCRVLMVVCFLVVGFVICYKAVGSLEAAGGAVVSAKFLQRTSETPRPPQPYEYNRFMTWLKQADFTAVTGWAWKPEVAEFDLDAAAHSGKFAPYMTGPEADMVQAATKNINKFVFMGDIMRTGSLGSVGAPGTHLYILKTLAASTASKGQPHPTFLDAGCGPGYLLLAWTLICGPGSKAVGLDIDKDVVSDAQQYLASPEALAPTVQRPAGATTEAHVGDALRPDASALGLTPGSVDAVNLGLAVKSLAQLESLVRFLRVGGLLLAPLCLDAAAQPKDVPQGRCEGRLRLYRKSADGTLERVPGDPEIPVRFVVSATDLPSF